MVFLSQDLIDGINEKRAKEIVYCICATGLIIPFALIACFISSRTGNDY
ncbi:hypothetical protein ECMA6_4188 [Escherichia coli MA6]|nr:hypothetical protein ECMA6_4188 [Escherichia coli MA6]